MNDTIEKEYGGGGSSEDGPQSELVVGERPTSLKGFYYHPVAQVVMLGFVCFMGPGLYNALNGLGAGGQVDATTASNANVAVYSTFAAGAFFSGTVNNKLGSRLTLLLGTVGYSLYIGAFLPRSMKIHPHAGPFVIAAGAILGICAGLLWTAQGSLMLAYGTESQKGVFIGIFWSIFNLGAVVGSAVSLAENIKNQDNSVGKGTYIGLLILSLIGVTIPMAMADPNKMIRTDGTRVTSSRQQLEQPSWKGEIIGLWKTVVDDPLIILLFPMFFASNWFYTWQFNDYNAALFNARTRSLNDLVYWLSEIFGSIAIGLFLDTRGLSRRTRAFSGWALLLSVVFIVQIWAFFYQRNYTRESVLNLPAKIDIHDSEYVGRILLFITCGILDSMWQTTTYWLVGTMSNDRAKLAYLSGFFRSIGSAGAAGVWRADAVKLPYMNIFLSDWILLVSGLVFALPMIHLRVKNYTDLPEQTIERMDEEVSQKSS